MIGPLTQWATVDAQANLTGGLILFLTRKAENVKWKKGLFYKKAFFPTKKELKELLLFCTFFFRRQKAKKYLKVHFLKSIFPDKEQVFFAFAFGTSGLKNVDEKGLVNSKWVECSQNENKCSQNE